MKVDTSQIPSILIIDDDEDDCFLFRHAVAEVSSRIVLNCLQDTDHLFEVIESTKPTLIFLDFKLPRENGIDCAHRLKEHPEFKKIPVIMWSTFILAPIEMAAYSAGVQNYMKKPWCFKELVEKIKTIIQYNVNLLGNAFD